VSTDRAGLEHAHPSFSGAKRALPRAAQELVGQIYLCPNSVVGADARYTRTAHGWKPGNDCSRKPVCFQNPYAPCGVHLHVFFLLAVLLVRHS
jgi:hypothetical protein